MTDAKTHAMDFRTMGKLYRILPNPRDAWEPLQPRHAFFDRMIAAGFVERVDGRFMFERFKDSHARFTALGLSVAALLSGGVDDA